MARRGGGFSSEWNGTRAPFDPHREVTSSHFRVFHESNFPPAGILVDLEGLRAKLLVDLVEFAPWAKTAVIDVFLFKDAGSYHSHTGMSKWAGGHVIPGKRKIFIYESPRFQRTMAHEMAHLFFDDFFITEKKHPPRWLNEGVATLMEWDYGLEKDEERINKRAFSRDLVPLERFFKMDYHDGTLSNDQVSKWYLQAYCLVRVLLRSFSKHQFYGFCGSLREGKDLSGALKTHYGLEIPHIEALEKLLRQSLLE